MPQSVSGRHFMLLAAKLPLLGNANGQSVSGMRVLVTHGKHRVEIRVSHAKPCQDCPRDPQDKLIAMWGTSVAQNCRLC